MADTSPTASQSPPLSSSPTLLELADGDEAVLSNAEGGSTPLPPNAPPEDTNGDKTSPNSRTGLHLRARAKKILAKSTSVMARSEGKDSLFDKVSERLGFTVLCCVVWWSRAGRWRCVCHGGFEGWKGASSATSIEGASSEGSVKMGQETAALRGSKRRCGTYDNDVQMKACPTEAITIFYFPTCRCKLLSVAPRN